MLGLRQYLKAENSDLFYEFERIRKKAEGGLLDYQTIYGDTVNGLAHVKDVEAKLDRLIPDDTKAQLSDFEVYLLLSAVYLHDIGKIRQEYYAHHSQISQETIDKCHTMLGIDNEHVATVIAWIAYGHGNDSIDSVPGEYSIAGYGEARVGFLAALLRLGDELSVTYQRAPRILEHMLDGIGKQDKWRVRRSVSDVVIDPTKWTIKMFALSESEDNTSQLRNLESYVQRRLEEIRPYLLKNGISYSKIDLQIESRDRRKRCVRTAGASAETCLPSADGGFLRHVRVELGVQRIERHRSSFPFDDVGKMLDSRKNIKEVDLSGKGLAGLFRAPAARQNLKELIGNGCRVRVLILSKNIELPQVNEINKLIAEDQTAKIEEVLDYLRAMKKETVRSKGTLQYKFTEKIMYISINRADDEMMVTHYLGSLEGNLCPTLWIKGESTSLFETYKQEFDDMWRDGHYPENVLELDRNIVSYFDHAMRIKQALAVPSDLPRIPPPLMAILFPTMECEENCTNCTYKGERDEGSMNFELLNKVINELIEFGVEAFEFTGGGEPLLYSKFPELLGRVAAIKAAYGGVHFGLLTNGLHIDALNQIELERLVSSFSYIRFSYVEAIQRDKARIARFKFTLRKLITLTTQLRRQKKSGVAEISLKMLLSKSNHSSILRTVKRFFDEFPELGYFMIKPLKSRRSVLDENRINEVEAKLLDYKIVSNNTALQLDLRPTPYYAKFKCWISPLCTVVTPNGSIYICCNYHLDRKDKLIGKVTLDNKFKDIWGGLAHKTKIKNLNVANCDKPDYCNCRFFRYQEILEKMFMYHPTAYQQPGFRGSTMNCV